MLLVALGAATISAAQFPTAVVRPEKIDPAKHIVALDLRWTMAFASSPAAPAGYDEQTAYVPLKGGELVAVDLDTGTERWKVEIATAFTPATGDGLVFAAGDALVTAFEDLTGATAWRTPVGGPLSGPIHFDAGTLFVAKTDGELLSLTATDGAVQWRRSLGAALALPPAAAGDRVYLALADGTVRALARDTGEPAWSRTIADPVTGLLALDEQLIVGTRGNRLSSLHLSNGRVVWEQKAGADVSGAAAADEDHIYFVALDNVLRALSRGNGNILWTAKIPSRPVGGPLRTGDVVVVPTVSADIGAYSAKTGKAVFTLKAAGDPSGVPFLREAARPTAPRLIAVSLDGKLEGFAPRFEPPLSLVPFAPPGTKVGA